MSESGCSVRGHQRCTPDISRHAPGVCSSRKNVVGRSAFMILKCIYQMGIINWEKPPGRHELRGVIQIPSGTSGVKAVSGSNQTNAWCSQVSSKIIEMALVHAGHGNYAFIIPEPPPCTESIRPPPQLVKRPLGVSGPSVDIYSLMLPTCKMRRVESRGCT